jgi:hypothetical protein
MKRRNVDFLHALIAEMHPGPNNVWRELFMKEIMPRFTLSPWAYQEITEAEYEYGLQRIKIEAPHFARWLLNNHDRLVAIK